MAIHYSQPKGFVGRNICYAILFDGVRYGSIVAGSSTLHLPGRFEFLGLDRSHLNNIINNIFFHVEKIGNKYPTRCFTEKCLKLFRKQSVEDWKEKYGDEVLGFESLIELPRTGACYIADGWHKVGITKGFTCKRTGGNGSDSWGGKRVWSKDMLRPKLVFCRKP